MLCEDSKNCYTPHFSICRNHAKPTRAFNRENDLIGFAVHAKRRLKEALPASLCMPILRVDIMIMQSGQLVVNEFESLEAMTDVAPQQTQLNTGRADPNTDAKVNIFLEQFWAATIKVNFEHLLSSF